MVLPSDSRGAIIMDRSPYLVSVSPPFLSVVAMVVWDTALHRNHCFQVSTDIILMPGAGIPIYLSSANGEAHPSTAHRSALRSSPLPLPTHRNEPHEIVGFPAGRHAGGKQPNSQYISTLDAATRAPRLPWGGQSRLVWRHNRGRSILAARHASCCYAAYQTVAAWPADRVDAADALPGYRDKQGLAARQEGFHKNLIPFRPCIHCQDACWVADCSIIPRY